MHQEEMAKKNRDIPCSWREANIVGISLIANQICRFNAIPIKIRECYFVGINKLILKFIWRDKRHKISNIILKEKKKVRGQILLNFKTDSKPIVIMVEWVLEKEQTRENIEGHKRKYREPANRHIYSCLITGKRAKAIQ